jgi:hypothetical protein
MELQPIENLRYLSIRLNKQVDAKEKLEFNKKKYIETIEDINEEHENNILSIDNEISIIDENIKLIESHISTVMNKCLKKY